MKQKKIPEFTRKNILWNLNPLYDKYNMIYVNYEEIKEIPGNFIIEDFIELLQFYKEKKSMIFTNFNELNKINNFSKSPNNKDNKKNNKTKDKKNEIKENEYEDSEKVMKNLKEIYDLTQIFFFDFKQAKKKFKVYYEFLKKNQKN